ncbi:hypothetical protein HU200_048742 [Digitaria exilis]|uniref:DNA-directed RNA polymerase RpoA/D/Rpb3-type domain-containing protein n=1 Tax=Digitaria exilis TaxID=1010633 RepID=A0A835E8X4_9POAL|nr:hypothetical protein HU200_048742 [Digitaria exilis]
MPKKGTRSKKDNNMPDWQENNIPDYLEVQRTRVVCNADAPIHVYIYMLLSFHVFASVAYDHLLKVSNTRVLLLMGVDNSVSVDKFCKNFKIDIKRLTEDDMEFDMIGVDASIANAFWRILIAEVPTMAIEKIFMADNTSVIAYEVLSHRLGVIPLDADPRLFDHISENDVPNERNTIVYGLHVSCEKGSQRITEGSQLSMASPGQSGDKQKTFTSFGQSQKDILDKPFGVKFKDITIARLGPGQAIELEAHAIKGIGNVHAKWSPVATTWYRMLPEVVFLKQIEGDEAEELVKKCPVNVFDIEDLGNGRKRAVVAKPRACTLCRECVMGPSGEKIQLRRVRDHFILKCLRYCAFIIALNFHSNVLIRGVGYCFSLLVTIESTGALPPEVLFTEAVKILEEKCGKVISELS